MEHKCCGHCGDNCEQKLKKLSIDECKAKLIVFAKEGNSRKVFQVLNILRDKYAEENEKFDVNMPLEDGKNVLEIAYENGHLDLAQQLIFIGGIAVIDPNNPVVLKQTKKVIGSIRAEFSKNKE